MAIFLQQFEINLPEEDIVKLDIRDAHYRLIPMELIPDNITSNNALFPYHCYLEKTYKTNRRYDLNNSSSEYVGMIYLTINELQLIKEHGIDYFKTLICTT